MRELKKVLLVTNVPQTYRIPLFNELAVQLKEKNIDLKVVFASDGYKRRKTKIDLSEIRFDYEILKSLKFNFGDVEKTIFTYGGLNKVISAYQPDRIIVAGYSFAAMRIFLRSLTHKSLKYIIWSGSIEFPGRYDSSLRKMFRRLLIRRASGFIAYGSKAKEYLTRMGAPSEKVSIGINTVDTTFFREDTNRIRSSSAEGIKRLLFVGYLVPRKNVSRLIQIIEVLAATRNDFELHILGDGSDRLKLEEKVREKGMGERIIFHGFVQKKDLPQHFAASTVFLFQTDFDIWGLVLNEAMAAGIATLSSVNAGATFDLIEEGRTGFAIDYTKPEDVLDRINFLLDNPEKAREIGKNAQAAIEMQASIRISAAGFIRSILQSD
jgi:glycosyltransferase involved in cell wall biosynthesis